MRALQAVALILIGACSWSNSLYQARAVSAEALKAEREDRPGDADNAWGRAAFKAESAYVRSPAGTRAAEALWLQGRALARGRDCVRASAALERSALIEPNSPWREPLLFELARCREALQDQGAIALFEQLALSRDTTLQRMARRRVADALMRDRRWAEALPLLREFDEPQVRANRAVALVALGQTDEALAEVQPLLASADTALDFAPLVEMLATQRSVRTEELLAALSARPSSTPEQRARWLLSAVRGALLTDPAAVDRRLALLIALPSNAAVRAGQLLAAERMVSRAGSPAGLLVQLDSLTQVAEEGLTRLRADELRRTAASLLEEERSTPAGAPRGDLVLFALAEVARDSLVAPMLASWLFARIERDWPQSPYRAKALLARLPLAPDSAASLRGRLLALPPNPYVEYLRGQQSAGFVQLEDSLRAFGLERARAATGRRTRSSDAPDRQ